MKRLVSFCVISLFMIVLPFSVIAADYAEIDKLNDVTNIESYKKAIDLCQKALSANPNDYETAWRLARSYRWVGELSKREELKDWEDICAKNGKEGMKYAQKAIDLQPNKPNGYYWYALNVGIYSDGVSILTALKEGLKNKTQESFEKVYELDKQHEKGGSILGLGRFWYVLPWPLNDKDLSMKYYREYQKTQYFGNPHEDGPIYLAELLIDLGGDENEAEAKKILEKSAQTDSKYFKKQATNLMEKLD